MKKMILLLAVVLFAAGAQAQHLKTETISQDPVISERYCVELKDGKTTLMQDNKPVTTEVALNDGSKVTPAGMIIKKDGTIVALKAGDCIDREGNVNNAGAPQTPIREKQENNKNK